MGGNAISPKEETGTIKQQFSHTRDSLAGLKHFVRQRYNICITHGNGPQIGAELIKNENSEELTPPLPLGILVANTQGAIGYMIQQSLQNLLYTEDSNREVVTFISQVKVDKNDPAISNPTKYIGKRYSAKEKEKLQQKFDWQLMGQEKGEWRRVVSSPTPLYIFNGKSIKHLVEFGTIVIAGGGGGIPSYNDLEGNLQGLDGVIDKDMSAALLGRVIRAEELFIITDVDNVYLNYKKSNQTHIKETNISDMQKWLLEGHFSEGTMAPKIRAALYFLSHHGEKVVITSLKNIESAVHNKSGTVIYR